MQTIAIAAHKGGAGKTTVAVNLAGALAARGLRVLVVDGDPQGAAGAALAAEVEKPTLYEALTGQATASDALCSTRIENITVLPADLDLAGAEVELPRRPDWQIAIVGVLRPLSGRFDVALVDTAPGLGVLPYAALVAATGVLVTCPPEYLAYRALPHVLETVTRARELTPALRLLGIVPVLVSRRSRHEREVLDAFGTDYPGQVLTEIPRRVILQDAQLAGQPVATYAPQSDAAAAFTQLAEEVLRRGQATQPARSSRSGARRPRA
jgi:chromosome partitioning protein